MSTPRRRHAIRLNGEDLTISDFYAIAVDGRTAELATAARRRMTVANRVIRNVATHPEPVYGVTTGFGKLADQRISPSDIAQLQLNLVRSHAAGIGDPLTREETRGIMLLRANVLARGYSGVRPIVVESLLTLLNREVLPVIPCRGSVGASGDLAPLAHLALPLIGEGEAWVNGRRRSGQAALAHAGLKPLTLEAKEGLSLVNGTQAMLALGLLDLRRADQLVDTADVAGALTVEALKGTPVAFEPRIQALRPYPGQQTVAANLLALMAKSEIRVSHLGCPRVQDAYSLRCMPQVHGAVRDALGYVRRTLEIEINSVTDNPIVFPEDGEVVSGGNFHGQPLGLVLDHLAIAITELASIAERRIERLTNPEYGDLPPFLSPDPGLNSGFMLAQVTAAALASENKVLSHPASVDSIPTSGNQEDHVSMGMGSALKLKQVIANAEYVLAIELLCAAQGVDFHRPLRAGVGTRRAVRLIRRYVPWLGQDRMLAPDIERVRRLIEQGEMSRILSAVAGDGRSRR
ncbi:MAG TPA: histidine ammonia-lyase [Nitrospiraceae bacterium]|nr:histidine ammonia-lyase [Nitrospiraceae bacterium]